jgi:outer membrane protein OmpA-like peptidoglycan-associated protein
MRMNRTLVSSLVAGTIALVAAKYDAHAAPPGICQNVDLLNAVRIIDSACTPQFCDPAKLKELENVTRSDLLRALRDPQLMPVHIFFPAGKRKLTDAFDWATIKEDQLRTISDLNDPEHTTIFIIGYASKTGDEAMNVGLSRDRMYAVYFYLKNVLKVKCKLIKGAWVGKTVLQLHESDAQILNLVARDYRSDPLILNQSVHVFIYPCGL